MGTAAAALSDSAAEVDSMAVRNPLVALFMTLFETAIFSPILCVPLLLFPPLGLPVELSLLWGIAAFAAAGAIAGRFATFAATAFVMTFIGGFIGYAVFFGLAFAPVNLLHTAMYALIAGVGGWASAKRRASVVREEVDLEAADKRRCKVCGVRVGLWAKKCWSCRASLARYT